MPALSNNAIQEALSSVLANFDVREAYLYGSYARNEQTPDSDIDLRFLCGDSITYGDLYHISDQLEKRLNAKVDILTCRPAKLRPGFYERIKNDEVMLYAAH